MAVSRIWLINAPEGEISNIDKLQIAIGIDRVLSKWVGQWVGQGADSTTWVADTEVTTTWKAQEAGSDTWKVQGGSD